MTWDVYRDREWEPHEAELAVQADQMRKVEARVTDFAPAHGLQRITLALTGARLGTWGAARSSKMLGNIELGHYWFFPEGAPSLPHIVEHELAHVERNDSARHQLRTAAIAAGSVVGAGLLPLSHVAACWWTDPSCGTIAARRSGRVPHSALTHFLHDRRALPVPLRLIAMVVALRSHPLLLLRRWRVRHVPDLPGSTRTRRPRPAVLATDQFHARPSGSHPVSANVASCTREGVGSRNSFR